MPRTARTFDDLIDRCDRSRTDRGVTSHKGLSRKSATRAFLGHARREPAAETQGSIALPGVSAMPIMSVTISVPAAIGEVFDQAGIVGPERRNRLPYLELLEILALGFSVANDEAGSPQKTAKDIIHEQSEQGRSGQEGHKTCGELEVALGANHECTYALDRGQGSRPESVTTIATGQREHECRAISRGPRTAG